MDVTQPYRPALWPALLLLASVTLALRLDTFFHALILPTDEGLYYRMAVQWLEGTPFYQGNYDHKPPGIYYLYALAMAIGGKSMMVMRWATVLAAMLGAWSVFLLSRKALALYQPDTVKGGGASLGTRHFWHCHYAGLSAGLAYAALSCLQGGLSANTEIFFVPAIVFGLWALVGASVKPRGRETGFTLLAGFLGGIAFVIKYTVVFEAAVVASLWLAWVRGGHTWQGLLSMASLRAIGLVAAGFLLPPGLVILHFALGGRLDVLYHQTIAVNLMHAGNSAGQYKGIAYAYYFGRALASYGLVVAAALWVLVSRQQVRGRLYWLALGWVVASTVAARLTGHLFDHYLIEVLPALCFCLALFMHALLHRGSIEQGLAGALVAIIATGSATMVAGYTYPTLLADVSAWRRGGHPWAADPIYHLAGYVRHHLTPGQYFYAVEGNPTLYVMSERDLPTPFVFWPFQQSPYFAKITGVNQQAELERMLGLPPTLILAKTLPDSSQGPVYARLRQEITQHYALADTVAGWRCYRRR